MSERQRLSPDEARLVLRRAAELERRREERGDDHVSATELEEIAREVGISTEAVRTAIAEVRTGVVATSAPPDPSFLDRAFGPADLVSERSVPGSVGAVKARIAEAMTRKLMQIQRNFGDRAIWIRQRGLVAGVMRLLDFSGRYAWSEDVAIETQVVPDPHDAGRSLVQVGVRLGAERRKTVFWTGAGVTTGGGMAGLPLALGAPPEAQLVLGIVGTTTAGMSYLLGRRSYRKEMSESLLPVEQLLDELEHG